MMQYSCLEDAGKLFFQGHIAAQHSAGICQATSEKRSGHLGINVILFDTKLKPILGPG